MEFQALGNKMTAIIHMLKEKETLESYPVKSLNRQNPSATATHKAATESKVSTVDCLKCHVFKNSCKEIGK